MQTARKALEEVSGILQRAGWSDSSIHIGGSVINSQVVQTMLNSTNAINRQVAGESKELLDRLRAQVTDLLENLPADKVDEAETIAENLQMVVRQATNKKPDREWFLLSAKGLLEASRWNNDFAGDIRGSIVRIGQLIWPDFAVPHAG